MPEQVPAGLEKETNRVGRTTRKTIMVTSASGEIFPVEIYNLVNVSEDRDLRTPLLDGSLNLVDCPFEEGKSYELALPVVYHDEEIKLFALLIPESLRHQELRLRRELWEELERSKAVIPGYMRDLRVIFSAGELLKIEESLVMEVLEGDEATMITSEESVRESEAAKLQERIQELEGQLEQKAAEAARLQQEREQGDQEAGEREEQKNQRAELDQRAEELEALQERLKEESEQLQSVASRVERDSAHVNEATIRIQQETAELERWKDQLDEERRRLQVMELNLEQEKLRLQQAAPDTVHEATQVVTDDQFIEIVSDENAPSAPVRMPSDSADIPVTFAGSGKGEGPSFVLSQEEVVVVGYKVDEERAALFMERNGGFYFQLHEVEGVPVAALTLVVCDEQEHCLDAVVASLQLVDAGEARILKEMQGGKRIHAALYDQSGDLITAWETGGVERENLSWALAKMKEWEQGAGAAGAARARAAAEFLNSGEIEIWGAMRHPFHSGSFSELEGAAEVQLAAGIVEYWSRPEQMLYLVGNRAFPLAEFREIQKRVVRQALHWGIAPGEMLRRVAIESAIIPDLRSLTQRLLANFTEVCVGIRPNDLDPLEQWENWEALIALAESQGVSLDPSMVELAEQSLKRAEEFEEALAEEEEEVEALSMEDVVEEIDMKEQVVSRHSETTGVTYFLADEDVMDTFEDLTSLEREDLLKLLKDQNGRLEAAQILVDRYGSEELWEILEAAEKLNAAQLEALTRFVEVRADGLEAALMQGLNQAGPAATYLVARALVGLGTTAALPRLLDALGDRERRGPGKRLAECLAGYGDKLLPPLSRELKKKPESGALLSLLSELEKVRPGTLEELRSDRNPELQKAAERAEQLS